MHAVLLASALLVGCLLAVQASVNLQLNKAVGTPYGASTLQLSVAVGLLLVLAVATGAIGAVRLVPDVPAWLLLGGLFSPLYITSGILLFPRLGALATVGLFVTGQMFASLALDLLGLLEAPQRSLTAGIALGAAVVLAGIIMIIRGQRVVAPAGPAAGSIAPPVPPAAPPGQGGGAGLVTATIASGQTRSAVRVGRVGWIALGIVAGAGLPVQGAINAQLRSELVEPLAVATISFTVATTAIAIVLLGLLGIRATTRPKLRPLAQMPWWGWLGGGCAAAYVTATFLLIPEIGAATTVALTVTGQQLASAAIDSNGRFRMPKRAMTRARTAGLVLLVAGSALVQLA
jgi:transporter family-2 protein